MNLILEIPDDRAARYRKEAEARGLTVDRWLLELADKNAPTSPEDASPAATAREADSGMVEENGLFVYRTGNPLPVQLVDEAVRRSREGRALHVLGDLP